jgi:hypothetical protein
LCVHAKRCTGILLALGCLLLNARKRLVQPFSVVCHFYASRFQELHGQRPVAWIDLHCGDQHGLDANTVCSAFRFRQNSAYGIGRK